VIFHRVTIEPDKMAGQPCIRGLRAPVATVVAMVADVMTTAEILADLPELEAGMWRRPVGTGQPRCGSGSCRCVIPREVRVRREPFAAIDAELLFHLSTPARTLRESGSGWFTRRRLVLGLTRADRNGIARRRR
jgi:hypothetical protein